MEKLNKKLMIKASIAVVALLFALGFFLFTGTEEENISFNDSAERATTENKSSVSGVEAPEENLPKEIYVHVDGQVVSPQVVKLPEGSRVYEAIEKVGGLAVNADSKQLNLATKLNDGDKVYIPAINEPASTINQSNSPLSNSTSNISSGLVNINTATSEQLETLQGVGPSTAEKIINYRNNEGKFEKIEDLKNVSGIGDKTFQKFMDKICVN